MSEFFIGQIMMAGFNFAPKYWALCNGQLLPINQNQALFSLLGTQYGGNGVTNFALPDLRSRTPIGYASSVDPGWVPLFGITTSAIQPSLRSAFGLWVSSSSMMMISPRE